MVALAALFLTLTLGQDRNLFKVVPSPTGRNGYEEYVQAAIILSRPENRALENYVRSAESRGAWQADRPASIPEGTNLLQAYRIEQRALAPAIRLIQAGNQKQVVYPSSHISVVTLFPELSYFKVAARMMRRNAFIAFADGNPTAGTQAILDGLIFSKKIAVGSAIHFLVSGACEQIMFGAVEEHLGGFSLRDVDQIQSWAESATSAPSGLAVTAETERKSIHDSVVDLLSDPTDLLDVVDIKDEDRPNFVKNVKAIPSARREVIYNTFFKRLEWPWDAVLLRLQGPEKTWLDPIEVDASPDEPAGLGNLGATEGQASVAILQLMSLLGAGDDQVLGMVPDAARSRIQERLVGIYAGVLRSKWLNGKLPGTLREAFGTEPLDPATGEAYAYELQVGGGFRIVCPTKRLGEVDLVYSSAKAGGDEGPVPPK